MPIAWAELPAPVQQLVYEGLGVMGVLALNREWRACRERRVAERLPCDTHNVPSTTNARMWKTSSRVSWPQTLLAPRRG